MHISTLLHIYMFYSPSKIFVMMTSTNYFLFFNSFYSLGLVHRPVILLYGQYLAGCRDSNPSEPEFGSGTLKPEAGVGPDPEGLGSATRKKIL